MHWRNREIEMIKSIMKTQVFSSSWVLDFFFFFFYEKMSTSYVTCYVLYSCRKTFKQPFTDVFQDRCSEKFRNICRKTPVLETLFNKFTRFKAGIFIKKDTPTRAFSYEYCKIFLWNVCSLYFSETLCDDGY